MKPVALMLEALEDIAAARKFYDAIESRVGDYFINSIFADIEGLELFHGAHSKQFGLHKMNAKRFPYGIFYRETETETQVVAVIDLRRRPSTIRKMLKNRR